MARDFNLAKLLTDDGLISATDVIFDTSTLFVDSGNNRVGIGTTSPTQALEVTGNAIISGDLTVSGTTTTINTTNTVVADNLIELNNGAASNSNDSGIVIERGSTGDNAFMGWDESADSFIVGTTTATGSSTGDLTITAAPLTVSALTASSGAFSGDVTFGDNDKAIFGAGNDLQIYHDGSNSYIDEAGTGDIYVSVVDDIIFRTYGTNELVARFNTNQSTGGWARLYHRGSEKLETTSTGVDVTGTLTSDGLTVAGNILLNGEGDELQFNTTGNPVNKIYSDDTYTTNGLTIDAENGVTLKSLNNYLLLDDTATNEMVLNVDNGERMRVTSTGVDITGSLDVTDAATTRTNLDVDQAGTAVAMAIALG